MAYSFTDGNLYLGSDYVHLFYHIKSIKSHAYWGIGGYLDLSNNHSNHAKKNKQSTAGLGARIPIGIIHYIKDTPLHVFIETAVRSLVIPALDTSLDLALGIRYRF